MAAPQTFRSRAIGPQATPSARYRLARARRGLADDMRASARALRRHAGGALLAQAVELAPRVLRVLVCGTVAAIVLALPLGDAGRESAPAQAATRSALGAASVGSTSSRDVLTQQRLPLTVTREGPPEIRTYVVQEGDTLITIAAHYGITVETLAYNNNVTDPTRIHIGDEFKIPPMDAAIYEVKPGDSTENVARYFKADLNAVMETNRLYFEPQNFAVGKTVLIPVTEHYPDFVLKDSVPIRPEVIARGAPPATITTRPVPGRLGWPVGGIITQYFWYGHQGVDIAAPYGSGIAAPDRGTVSAVGWVAVGGLRVCLTHDWGMLTCYYHTSAVYVTVGQRVLRGQVIAAIGLTGVTTGPHVHWEARYNGALVNPLAY